MKMNKKKSAWIIIGSVLFVGIFLRTYHFHDWLRFNSDQARDASLVSEVIEGQSGWPLLGPKAGGTDFRLGPFFYQMQIVSGKIFGNYPDKIAYFELLLSILTIPLLYSFLRGQFGRNFALAGAAIFSLSCFAVKYSRFSWNPNSMPFWTVLLFLSLQGTMFSNGKKRKLAWAVLTGLSAGVLIQLHTVMLIAIPFFLLSVLAYDFFSKNSMISWRTGLLVVAVMIMTNTPQIVSEFRTGWGNARDFFQAIGTKDKKNESTFKNILKNTVCYSQGSAYILTGYEASNECEISSLKKPLPAVVTVFGFMFLAGGIILAFKDYRKEKDADKKAFLFSILSYMAISFALFIPLANEISMRFYLIFVPVAYGIAGTWFLCGKQGHCISKKIWLSVIVFLIIANLIFSVKHLFGELDYQGNEKAPFENMTLGETEKILEFMTKNQSNNFLVSASAKISFKAIKPLKYLAENKGKIVTEYDKKKNLGQEFFYIGSSDGYEEYRKSNNVLLYENMGRLTVYKVRN